METRSKKNTRKPRVPWSPSPVDSPGPGHSSNISRFTSRTVTSRPRPRPGPSSQTKRRKTHESTNQSSGNRNRNDSSSSSSSDISDSESDDLMPPPPPPNKTSEMSSQSQTKNTEKKQEQGSSTTLKITRMTDYLNHYYRKTLQTATPTQQASVTTHAASGPTPPMPVLSPQPSSFLLSSSPNAKFKFRRNKHPPKLSPPHLPTQGNGRSEAEMLEEEIEGIVYEIIDLSTSCSEDDDEIIELTKPISDPPSANLPRSKKTSATITSGQASPIIPTGSGLNLGPITRDYSNLGNPVDLRTPRLNQPVSPTPTQPVQFPPTPRLTPPPLNQQAFVPFRRPSPYIFRRNPIPNPPQPRPRTQDQGVQADLNKRSGNSNGIGIGQSTGTTSTAGRTEQERIILGDVPVPPEIEQIYLPIFKTLSQAGKLMSGVNDITGSAIPQLGQLLETVAKGESKLWMPPTYAPPSNAQNSGSNTQNTNATGTGTGNNGGYGNPNLYVDENGDRWIRQH